MRCFSNNHINIKLKLENESGLRNNPVLKIAKLKEKLFILAATAEKMQFAYKICDEVKYKPLQTRKSK